MKIREKERKHERREREGKHEIQRSEKRKATHERHRKCREAWTEREIECAS